MSHLFLCPCGGRGVTSPFFAVIILKCWEKCLSPVMDLYPFEFLLLGCYFTGSSLNSSPPWSLDLFPISSIRSMVVVLEFNICIDFCICTSLHRDSSRWYTLSWSILFCLTSSSFSLLSRENYL